MNLRESLLKNIKQDDNGVIQMWIDEFNEYSNIPLIKGKDYTIDNGVLNYKNVRSFITNNMDINITGLNEPPKGLKLGETPKKPNGDLCSIRFSNLDFKSIDEILDKNFDDYIYIDSCSNVKIIDLSKFDKVQVVVIKYCDKLEKVILPKKMHNISIVNCIRLSSITGCKEVEYVRLQDCPSYNYMKGLPKKIGHDLVFRDINLKSLDGLPEEVGVGLYMFRSTLNGDRISTDTLSSLCKIGKYCKTS